MAKNIKYEESNDFLREQVRKLFSYSLEEAAQMMGVSGSQLRSELCRKRKDRNPGWLIDELNKRGANLELVTYVRRVKK